MNQTASVHRIASAIFLFSLTSMLLLATGCATVTSLTGKPVPVDSKVESPNGSYAVEMHPAFGSAKRYQGQLSGSTTVAEALKSAGAVKKFRSMDVEILRVVDVNGKSRGLRMPVSFDTRTGGPTPEQDYALLDGDRVVVRPKESSGLLKMATSILGAN